VFDRVGPSQGSVANFIEFDEDTMGGTHHKQFKIDPGQTLVINLGGTGRPVVGRATLPPDYNGTVDWPRSLGDLSASWDVPDPPYPKNWNSMDGDAKRKWWQEDQVAKAFRKKYVEQQIQRANTQIAFRVSPDGSFRVEDVRAGTYELTVDVSKPPAETRYGPDEDEDLGWLCHRFTVPKMEGGRSDEPLDLGQLEITVRKNLNVGDVAPAFEVPTLDGKTVRLSDYRGKVVLIDFWATWSEPRTQLTPRLKAVYKTFRDNDRFVMIGLNFDEDAEAVKDYVKQNGFKWTQGFLGDWYEAKLPAEYGVRDVPAMFLIGPDGKIVAKELLPPAIENAVRQALRNVAK